MPPCPCCYVEELMACGLERPMPVTFWWDLFGPSKRDLGLGEVGSVQVFVVIPGGRRLIFEPSAEVYFSTCELWNHSLPVHRLPTELLSHILMLAISPHGLESDPSGHPLARVCSLWREIILDTPAFWTTISNQSTRDIIRFKIQRSRSSKLDFIYLQGSSHALPGWQFKEIISPHMLRCNSFRIRISYGYYDGLWLNFQGSLIPRLIVDSTDSFLKQASKDYIPEDVENVCLENISIPWQSSYFPKLRSLQITGAFVKLALYDSEGPSAFSVIKDILRTCPCLKVLKLGPFQRRYKARLNETLMKGEIVSFPSLESLEMKGSSSDLFWQVLDYIGFPNLSKLVISPTRLDLYSGRTMYSVCRSIGGRSLLQSIIDRANCERLTIRIRRGPSAGITVQGINDAGKVISLDPLTKDTSTKKVIEVLKAIKSPVRIEISGETDGSFVRSVTEAATIASLHYLPYSQKDRG
ncbi:hypothetical protein FS837_006758 [Tulasnella sp. UAMH 9824]|nr:hypothetical protein FS837_006758 [Tulasnella sp. UAMH 9824]